LPGVLGGEKIRPMFCRAIESRLPALVACGLAALVSGCAAQTENFDDRDWTKEHGLQSGAWRNVETLFDASEGDVDRYNYILRGVRHDLTLRADAKADTRCSCLDVAVGRPGDKRFRWAEERPAVSPKHIVVSVRTEGSVCPGGNPERRPSIQAVDKVGQDVIVVIEELTYERPQALGAVVTKPGPDGHLWLRSRKSKKYSLPYARRPDAKRDMCQIDTDRRLHHEQIRSGRRF
jgi:hypothetical protein